MTMLQKFEPCRVTRLACQRGNADFPCAVEQVAKTNWIGVREI